MPQWIDALNMHGMACGCHAYTCHTSILDGAIPWATVCHNCQALSKSKVIMSLLACLCGWRACVGVHSPTQDVCLVEAALVRFVLAGCANKIDRTAGHSTRSSSNPAHLRRHTMHAHVAMLKLQFAFIPMRGATKRRRQGGLPAVLCHQGTGGGGAFVRV